MRDSTAPSHRGRRLHVGSTLAQKLQTRIKGVRAAWSRWWTQPYMTYLPFLPEGRGATSTLVPPSSPTASTSVTASWSVAAWSTSTTPRTRSPARGIDEGPQFQLLMMRS
ncbi:hypothetical protein QJS66_08510 [Kocuria rhizophila]|nr:hypothetical protein QJS66_08510 [Kocuria rhizophila]